MIKNNFQKHDRMSWDEFFIQIAQTAAQRTACLFYQVATVFVDNNHKIISIGYNGPSTGDYHCNEVGCAKVHGDPVTGEIKRCRGVHAEINAIANTGDTKQLKNATLYSTTFPCYDCMKVLNNLGIQRIVYLHEYLRIIDGSDGEPKEAEPEAKELAIKRGIICEQFRPAEKINNKYNGDHQNSEEKEKNNKRF